MGGSWGKRNSVVRLWPLNCYPVLLIPTAEAQVEKLSTVISGVLSDDSLQSVALGSNITLRCQFSGVPVPGTVTWTVDGRITTEGVDTTSSNHSTLELTNFQRPGIYQCHVTNLYGTASSGIALCETGNTVMFCIPVLHLKLVLLKWGNSSVSLLGCCHVSPVFMTYRDMSWCAHRLSCISYTLSCISCTLSCISCTLSCRMAWYAGVMHMQCVTLQVIKARSCNDMKQSMQRYWGLLAESVANVTPQYSTKHALELTVRGLHLANSKWGWQNHWHLLEPVSLE